MKRMKARRYVASSMLYVYHPEVLDDGGFDRDRRERLERTDLMRTNA